MATSSSSESDILFVLLSLFWLRNISIHNVYRYVCLLPHSEIRVFCWCRNCSAIVPTCWNSNMKVRELKLDVPRLLVLRTSTTGLANPRSIVTLAQKHSEMDRSTRLNAQATYHLLPRERRYTDKIGETAKNATHATHWLWRRFWAPWADSQDQNVGPQRSTPVQMCHLVPIKDKLGTKIPCHQPWYRFPVVF